MRIFHLPQAEDSYPQFPSQRSDPKSPNAIPDPPGLHQNFPNPFNPASVITYEVVKSSEVSLKVYDTLGRGIQTILSNFQESGTYSVIFEARDLPSGVYFYELHVGDSLVESKRMLLVK